MADDITVAQQGVAAAAAAVKEAQSDVNKAKEELNQWKADNPKKYAGLEFDALNTALKVEREALKESEVALEDARRYHLALSGADSRRNCGQGQTQFSQRQIITKMNGTDLASPHLDRLDLLESIIDVLRRERFVLLSSPVGSGKTSVLQLLEKRVAFPFKYVCAEKDTFCDDLLKQAGIDMVADSFNGASNRLIVMIDNAQNSYHDQGGWENLIKGIPLWLQSKKVSVQFIISATHSLKGRAESPEHLSWLHAFSRQAFLLSEIEANEFLDSPIGLRDDMKFGSLKKIIIAQCGGLVGALRLSVDSLSAQFAKSHPSESAALQYYMFDKVVSRMVRVFGSDHSYPVGDDFRNFLVECFTSGLQWAPTRLSALDDFCFKRLQKDGILAEEEGRIKFSSIMSQRYYQVAFPKSLYLLAKIAPGTD
ncbi:hypothetical protein HDU78_003170 [Chytriomyces hyalinus]|nr:hypothetical protein HDU78_003170 [Chytriomyces hyalinus]